MDKKMNTLPLARAAELLQTTELNVLMHIKRGLLAGEERDGQWHVSAASLETLLAKDDRVKGTVVCQTGHCGRGCGTGHCR